MKRVVIYLLSAAIVVVAILVYLFFRPDIGARIFLELTPHR